MSKGLRVTLVTIGGFVAVAALLLIGMNIGRATAFATGFWSDDFKGFRPDHDYPHGASMMSSSALHFAYGNSMMAPGMLGVGMMGMMGEHVEPADNAELPVGAQEAVEIAQRYLDTHLPGAEAEDSPDPYYGYYTLHVERDGKVVGMLSVDGITGQVWPHAWHGELLEMSDHE
ncbi:MAG: hypothetical protein BMS9Abin28_1648 [Anaerolineae bacterium]|nr:MAG: hypothetical protein BMS9Abin28_1648 [Anaerolineae bacterium]